MSNWGVAAVAVATGNVGLKVSFGDVNLGHFLVLVLMGST